MNPLGINGAGRIFYWYYKHTFFPKLLAKGNSTLTTADRNKLRELLKKPWNPYIRRHTALTEKSMKLKAHVLNQHSGWSPKSNMAQKYLHYYGNESSESLLEAYGIINKDSEGRDILKPKQCPQCSETNPIDAKFCSNCKMILTYEAYQDTLDSEKEKETELKSMKSDMHQIRRVKICL